MDLREGRSVCFKHQRTLAIGPRHTRALFIVPADHHTRRMVELIVETDGNGDPCGPHRRNKRGRTARDAPVVTGFQQRRSEEIAVPGEKILLHVLLCIAGQQKRYVAVLQLDHHRRVIEIRCRVRCIGINESGSGGHDIPPASLSPFQYHPLFGDDMRAAVGRHGAEERVIFPCADRLAGRNDPSHGEVPHHRRNATDVIIVGMRDDQEIDLRYPPPLQEGNNGLLPRVKIRRPRTSINERCLPGWELQEQSIPLPHIDHAEAEPRRIGRIRRADKDN